MKTETKYFNAKPSKISNIGEDVAGAKRMNYDTYETPEEKRQKAERKATNKKLKIIKEEIKLHLAEESPDTEDLANLLREKFIIEHGFDLTQDDAREIIKERRAEANAKVLDCDARKKFNRMINAYNKTRNLIASLNRVPTNPKMPVDYFSSYAIEKLRKTFRTKNTFKEETGKTVNWKDFDSKDIDQDTSYLEANTKAVQFGNTVTDAERAYILAKLSDFLKSWAEQFPAADVDAVSWSFGARGKAGSVAYYQHGLKCISVNRNNIGSLIHELGHFLDYKHELVSSKMSLATVREYKKKINAQYPNLTPVEKRYYFSKVEIFARAFEAYCYEINAGFESFAQCGASYLPDLNDELRELIKQALK